MSALSHLRAVLRVAAEVVVGVAAGLGLVAALDLIAPIASLGVVPLLVVLALAVHRGQLAALAAAVLSVLGLNYFFIPPVHLVLGGASLALAFGARSIVRRQSNSRAIGTS